MIMRVLAVRQPWASLIVEGLKMWEMRSKPTKIRGRVAIYSSTHNPTSEEKCSFNYVVNLLRNQGRQIPKKADDCIKGECGVILGSVMIKDCIPVTPISQIYSMHYNYVEASDCDLYAWELERPIKYEIPIPYKPPKGAVIWSKTELPEAIL